MPKEFNITGTCIPEMHYMVDITGKLNRIMPLIEKGRYFTINRPRQYGKTTTLFMLENRLDQSEEYLVFSISLEGIGDERLENERSFIIALFRQFKKCLEFKKETILMNLLEENKAINTLDEFSDFITELVVQSQRRIILMMDEVDKSSNNQLFLSFLGVLRNKYLLRNQGKDQTFHSVILAGVHDVKSLKLKLRPDEEQKFNSPWNIAVDFDVDLSFSSMEISTMLEQYTKDKNIAMGLGTISERLYFYTSGYPFLVSRLCKIIDENLTSVKEQMEWELGDIDMAVKNILQERNTNFESLIKNLENSDELYKLAYEIIMEGAEKSYNRDHPLINLGEIYGIFREENGKLKIHNRIYEQRIYNYMSSKVEISTNMGNYNFRDQFLAGDHKVDFKKVLLKFQEFMKEQYTERDRKFIEENGRLLFLAFIKPIINNKGFDFKEVQISEEKRLDVVVTYLEQKYVVELKIWRGEKAHENGIKQLTDYLERVNVAQGYLVIYDLRKTGSKKWQQETIPGEGKEIFAVWV